MPVGRANSAACELAFVREKVAAEARVVSRSKTTKNLPLRGRPPFRIKAVVVPVDEPIGGAGVVDRTVNGRCVKPQARRVRKARPVTPEALSEVERRLLRQKRNCWQQMHVNEALRHVGEELLGDEAALPPFAARRVVVPERGGGVEEDAGALEFASFNRGDRQPRSPRGAPPRQPAGTVVGGDLAAPRQEARERIAHQQRAAQRGVGACGARCERARARIAMPIVVPEEVHAPERPGLGQSQEGQPPPGRRSRDEVKLVAGAKGKGWTSTENEREWRGSAPRAVFGVALVRAAPKRHEAGPAAQRVQPGARALRRGQGR
mmetsp:Transcript_40321/g.133468  ORF Transcript_40321/g.133468 Transcript_40321/m.133468 type:complete len:320 (+) Transcript_40321:189-1148(+)